MNIIFLLINYMNDGEGVFIFTRANLSGVCMTEKNYMHFSPENCTDEVYF